MEPESENESETQNVNESEKGVVTITRSKWTHGTFYSEARDKYCAIGFAMRGAGFSNERIASSSIHESEAAARLVQAGLEQLVCLSPRGTTLEWNDNASDIIHANDSWGNSTVTPNDEPELTPERERNISEAFAKIGVKVIFED